MRKSSFFLAAAAAFLFSCSGNNPCDNLAGTTDFCINGDLYEVTYSHWLSNTNSVIVTLVENGPTLPNANLSFTLYNTANDTVPEAGTYTVVRSAPAPNGTRMAYVSGIQFNNPNTVNLRVDSTATQNFQLTSYNSSSMEVSGTYEGTLEDLNNSSVKYTIKAAFTNTAH